MNKTAFGFLAQGGDYFDTAYTYWGGLSEEALRKSLVQRTPETNSGLRTSSPDTN